MPQRVSKTQFAGIVERAMGELPPEFAALVEEVPVEIRDRPTTKQLSDVGLKEEDLLLGLYTGQPRTHRSVEESGRMPDVIYIFQEDHELIADSAEQMESEVRKTLLHEIGHHFGMSEDELDELGYG